MFMANGYHHSTIGYMSDINNISRAYCQKYFDENYVGSNIVVTLVGDVQFDEVQKYAKKYFSDIPAGDPQPVETLEPEQLGEKRMVLMDPSQPVFVAGYHIENVNHPDWPVYEVIADVLGQGRTSRLYKSMVKEQQMADSSLCQFGNKALVAEVKPGTLEIAVANSFQGVVAGLPGQGDPPGCLPCSLRRLRFARLHLHWQSSAPT